MTEHTYRRPLVRFFLPLITVAAVGFIVSSCSKKQTPTVQTSAGRGAMVVTDHIIAISSSRLLNRSAALLGVFVSQYAAQAVRIPVHSAWVGVQAQHAIAAPETTVADPDFKLLQAFADALQVDVSDLLNKSVDRQKSLDAYLTALTNVASRANERYNVLTPAVKTMQSDQSTLRKQQSTLKSAMQKNIDAKNFSQASDQQAQLTDIENQLSQKTNDLDKTQRIVTALNKLLTLYGQRLVAIQKNREPLILGTHVVDVPGATEQDLNILLNQNSSKNSWDSGTSASAGRYDSLFNLSWAINGLK